MAYEMRAVLTLDDRISGPMRAILKQTQMLDKAIKGSDKSLSDYDRVTKNAAASNKKLGSSFGNVNKGATSALRSITSLASAFGVGFGAATITKSLITTGASFDTAMSKVEAVTGASADQMALLRDQAKMLGESTVFSASEAADAMGFLGMAGFKTEDIIASMPGLLDLAAAGALDLGQAADIASNIMTGFNKQASEMGHISDVLAKSAASANTDVTQMGNAMSYVAPLASSMGISMEEVAAAVGMLSDAGIQGERAGTALRGIIAQLSNPTGQTAKMLDKIGLSADAVNPKFNSLTDIIDNLTKANFAAADSMELVGVEAGPGLAALMTAGSNKLVEFTKELENADGAAKTMAGIMNDNLGGSFKALKSAIEGVSIEIYEQLEPSLRDAITGMTENVKKFKAWFEKSWPKILDILKDLGNDLKWVGDLFGTVGKAAKSTVDFILDNWKDVKPFIEGIVVALGAWKIAQIAVNVAMAANPVGLVITAIGALAGGIYWLTQNWDRVKEATSSFWDTLKTKTTDGVNYVIDKVNELIRKFNELTSFSVKMPKWLGGKEYSFGANVPEIPHIGGSKTYESMPKPSGIYVPPLPPMSNLPSHSGGLSNVPYNGYVARLHQGERVLTAEQNREYSQGGGGTTVNISGGITVNGYGGSDPEQFADQLMEIFVRKVHAAGEGGA